VTAFASHCLNNVRSTKYGIRQSALVVASANVTTPLLTTTLTAAAHAIFRLNAQMATSATLLRAPAKS
jgi:hypothetical protein